MSEGQWRELNTMSVQELAAFYVLAVRYPFAIEYRSGQISTALERKVSYEAALEACALMNENIPGAKNEN